MGLTLLAIAALTAALAPLIGSSIEPRFAADSPASAFAEKLLLAAWWLLIARAMIALGQLAMRINHRHQAARLVSDLAGAVIYLGAVLAILDLDFGVSVSGLVATSGIIAIVLGLALQNTLGDLFSGIAIGIDRPFKIGDLILIEGAVEGRVVETNWRSTRVATFSNDVATVPNSVVAKSRITNRSVPSETHTGSVVIAIDPAVPPNKALSLLRASALNASLVSTSPMPSVDCTELHGDGSKYEITFSAPWAVFAEARSDLLHQVSRHARYNGVALAPQNGVPIVPAQPLGVLGLLDDVLIMQPLESSDRAGLSTRLVRHEGDADATLIRQGGSTASLFVVARGVFAVSRDAGDGPRRLGAIGPGEYFGELSLLTGSANAATVSALTPFIAYEITKEMIAPLLEQNPDLLHAFEDAASRARTLLDRTIAAQACSSEASRPHLLERIRDFFGMSEQLGARAFHSTASIEGARSESA